MKNILLLLLFIFIRLVDTHAQSNSKIDSLKNLLKFSKEDTNQVYLLDQIAGEYPIIMEYDSAYKYTKLGLKLARKLKYSKGIVIHLKNSCDYYIRKQNQTKALELIFEAYKITEEENLEKETMQVLSGISFAYTSFNNYKEAVRYKLKELRQRESLIHNPIYRLNNAKNLNNDSQRVSQVLGGLSFFHLKLNQIDSAFFYGKKALEYTNRIHKKDPSNLAYAFNCLGFAYRMAGKPDSAMRLFRNSIEQSLLSKKKNNKITNLYKSYWEIAVIFRDAHQIDSSIHYAEKALSYCIQLKWDKDALEIQSLLAKNYSGIDNNKAVFYYQQSAVLRDNLYNKEKTEQLQNITFNENERQNEIENQRKLAEEKRRKQINYAIIGLSIFLFLICFIALSRSIITSEKVNTLLAGLAVMMVFKFSNMLMDPYIEFKISDNPAILFFTAIVTASILSPIQKPIKKWLKVRMLAKAIAKAEPKTKNKKKVVKKPAQKNEGLEQDKSNEPDKLTAQ